MATILAQPPSVQDAFDQRIRQKVDDQRADATERVADRVPLIGGLLAPIAGALFDLEQSRKERWGERGEERVFDRLQERLPEAWAILPNAILNPAPDTFAQIDLLVFGPSGIYLIECKAWRGSYRVQGDRWQYRDERGWHACDQSPTTQVLRQTALLRQWITHQQRGDLLPAGQHPLTPVVVFTSLDWLGARESRIPVFGRTADLIQFLLAPRDPRLTPDQLHDLAHLLTSDRVLYTPTSASPAARPDRIAAPAPPPSSGTSRVTEPAAPSCPRCHVPLVLRRSRDRAPFYGCRNYPSCRETRPYEPSAPDQAAVAAAPAVPLAAPGIPPAATEPRSITPHPAAAPTTTMPVAPLCPRCGVPMVERVARQGAQAGQRFWGCPHFPRCRTVQPITGAASAAGWAGQG